MSTQIDWQEASQGRQEYEFAETADPRVLAVIERDQDAQISELYDGDAINPILYREHRGWVASYSWVAGYDDNSASIIANAEERLGSLALERYLWIFHGIVTEERSAPGDYDGVYVIVSSREYREHVGVTEPATKAEALEDCAAIAQDLDWALDGYVYGVGFATNEARRLPDDEPIDLLDGSWDIEIQCWGFVGEEYAKKTALDFDYGSPDLPEMLSIEVSQ